ncbi:MAG: VgrG-related protein [Chloroflexi bacterium]|nr:VgrG-related protein [Chloroflexota bacterium]MBP7043438.1 VgrG-related protein [Chloroflexota bacterium]
MPEVLSSQIHILVAGTEVQQSVMADVSEVTVEQHVHLPGMFTIHLYDKNFEYLDGGLFDLTKGVQIKAELESGTQITLIDGEVTALEPSLEEGLMTGLVVRGFDKAHRLYRETKSRAFLNVKDSDLASQLAGGAGLSAQVEATSTVYEHIFQHNQTDMALLMQRARRIGYECFVDSGKLYFQKPVTSGTAVSLTYGVDLVSFYPRMTLAEQVDQVIVKGWDPESQQAIVGQATTGTLYPANGESQNGAAWAGTFGTGKHIIVDQPVVSQAEANALAQARLDELSGGFVEAEGVAYRRPDVKAGKLVKLEKVGTRLGGNYLVTSAIHVYNPKGLTTRFTVRGARTGSLAEQVTEQEGMPRWPGLVTAVVTNTDDPKDWGRVKVKFPWMTDDAESDWARVISIGGGPTAGLAATQDVGDEVAVAFEHGDFNRPFVLGGLWNGQHAIPPEVSGAGSGEKPLVRSWHSRTGHYLAMYDNADNKIFLTTAGGHSVLFDDANKTVEIATTGGHKIVLDDQGKKAEVSSSGGHKITMDDNGRKISIDSSGDIQIKSATNLKLEAGAMLDIKASGPVNIKGAMVNLN